MYCCHMTYHIGVIYVTQSEAARQLGVVRNRKFSRAYINKLTKDDALSGLIKMSGTKVCLEDILNLPPRKVGRPRKLVNE